MENDTDLELDAARAGVSQAIAARLSKQRAYVLVDEAGEHGLGLPPSPPICGDDAFDAPTLAHLNKLRKQGVRHYRHSAPRRAPPRDAAETAML